MSNNPKHMKKRLACSMESSTAACAQNTRNSCVDIIAEALERYATQNGTTSNVRPEANGECVSSFSMDHYSAPRNDTAYLFYSRKETSHTASSEKMKQHASESCKTRLTINNVPTPSPPVYASKDSDKLDLKYSNFVSNIGSCDLVSEVLGRFSRKHGVTSNIRPEATDEFNSKLSVKRSLIPENCTNYSFYGKEKTFARKAFSMHMQHNVSETCEDEPHIENDFFVPTFFSSASKGSDKLKLKMGNSEKINPLRKRHKAKHLTETHSILQGEHKYNDQTSGINLQLSSTATTSTDESIRIFTQLPSALQSFSTPLFPELISVDERNFQDQISNYYHALNASAKRNSLAFTPDIYSESMRNDKQSMINCENTRIRPKPKRPRLSEVKLEHFHDREGSPTPKPFNAVFSMSQNHDAGNIRSKALPHDIPALDTKQEQCFGSHFEDGSRDEVRGTEKRDLIHNNMLTTTLSKTSSPSTPSKADFSNGKIGRENATDDPTPVSLALFEDTNWLTEQECYLRKHGTKLFIASADDVAGACNVRRTFVKVGQVGIRCKFCLGCDKSDGQVRAVYYPASISRLFKMMNIFQAHFKTCKKIPEDIVAYYYKMPRKGMMGAREYRISAAKKIDLVDIDTGGIRFKSTPLPSNQSSTVVLSSKAESFKPVETTIVRPGDELLVPGFLYKLFEQMQRCTFVETDRCGPRKKHKLGFLGLGCIHCAQSAKPGKYFPSAAKVLSTPRTVTVIFEHIQKCDGCPEDIKNTLSYLKSHHTCENFGLKRGTRQEFFNRLWIRIHDEIKDGRTTLGKTVR